MTLPTVFPLAFSGGIHPNVEKVGGLQSQGGKGDAVMYYREPLTTQDLKTSGFPDGLTTWQNRSHPLETTKGEIKEMISSL
jgi:hypothetical protein